MAPKKRQRGQSSQPSYDTARFVSLAASEKFDNVVSKKTIIPERGLRPGVIDGDLYPMIRERKWATFTAQPEPSVMAIVREFYANASEDSNVVRIRGVDVPFAPEHINAYYEVDDIEGMDQYMVYKTEHQDLEEVIRGLCRPDAQWTIKDGVPRLFNHKFLSPYGKAWYYFICAKLLPTTHVSEVIQSRAVLLYCLVNDKSIDIGRVISGSIKKTIHGGSPGGLPHPSLICGLCMNAGVEWGADEPVQLPKIPIDSRLIRSYQPWDGAPAHPRGAGFIFQAPPPDAEELVASPGAEDDDAVAQPTIASLAADIENLRREQRREHRRISRQVDYVAGQVNSMMSFNASFTSALTAMFARSGLNTGDNPVQFPEPPVIPAYPPTYSDDEDAAADA